MGLRVIIVLIWLIMDFTKALGSFLVNTLLFYRNQNNKYYETTTFCYRL